MLFSPYFVCALLGVGSLRGGLAEGNRITSQRLLDQSQAGVYRGKRHIPPPFWAFLGLFVSVQRQAYEGPGPAKPISLLVCSFNAPMKLLFIDCVVHVITKGACGNRRHSSS